MPTPATCPKCGASDQRGTECGACGLIFARWRPRDAKPAAPPPVAATPAKPPFNVLVVVPLAAVVLLVGVLWASSRVRSEGEEVETPAESAVVAPEPKAVRAKEGTLSDAEIRELIEECDYFQEHLTVTLPKTVQSNLMRLEDPRLRLAVNMGLLELDPGFDADAAARHLPNPANPGRTSTLRLGPNATSAISDFGDSFQIDLGRRRVEQISGVQRSAEKIGLFYRWTIDDPKLISFAPDHQELGGGAELRRSGARWKARLWRNTGRGALILCE